MTVREIDEVVDWVKSNILDMPKTDVDIGFKVPDVVSNTGFDPAEDQTTLRPTWADRNAPAEFEFPLSLLEHILGLDRI